MPGLKFLGRPHIENIEGPVFGFILPFIECESIGLPDAESVRNTPGTADRIFQSVCRRGRRRSFISVFKAKPGKMPPHGTVFKRRYGVGNAGIDQRLSADDAPCPARTVDHNLCVRIRYQIKKSVDQFRTGNIYGTRYVHPEKLLPGSGIENDELFPVSHLFKKRFSADTGCVLVCFDKLSECLADHIDTGKKRESGSAPSPDAAFQNRFFRITVL